MSLLLDALRQAEENKKKAGNTLTREAALTRAETPIRAEASTLAEKPTLEEALTREAALTRTETPIRVEAPSLAEKPTLEEALTLEAVPAREETPARLEAPTREAAPTQEEKETPIISSSEAATDNHKLSIRPKESPLNPALNVFAAGSKSPKTNNNNKLLWLLLLLLFILAIGMAALFYWEDQQQTTANSTDDLLFEEEMLVENSIQAVSVAPAPVAKTEEIQQQKTIPSAPYTDVNDEQQITENNLDSSEQSSTARSQPAVEQPLPSAAKENVTAQKPVIEITKRVLSQQLSGRLSNAYNALLAGNYDQAKMYYSQILSESPKQIDALLGLAKIYSHENNPAAARRLYEKVLHANDTNTIAQLGLLHTYQEDGSFEKIAVLQDLSAKYPQNPQIAVSLGHELVKQSKWSGAQEAYFQAFSLVPSNAVYAYNLAVSLDRLEKYDAAKAYYQKALALNEQSATTLNTATVKSRLHQLGDIYE